MRNHRKVAAFMAAAILSACPAFADTPAPIQMLPPTPLGSASVCAGGNQLLSYSGISITGGQSGINCPPIATDAQGDLAASGYLQIGDTAVACVGSLTGSIRFNFATNQFEGCKSGSWQTLGVSPVGKLYWSGAWTGNTYWCDSGYHVVAFHYDCGCSNSASWFECQAD